MDNGTFRSELFAFADAYIERSAALNPIAATDFGIDRYDHELTDFSLAHESETTEFVRSSLATLAAIVPTDDIDRIGKNVMTERLTATLGLQESGETRRTFSVLSSPASAIRQVFDLQPADDGRTGRQDPGPPGRRPGISRQLAWRPRRGLPRRAAGSAPPGR